MSPRLPHSKATHNLSCCASTIFNKTEIDFWSGCRAEGSRFAEVKHGEISCGRSNGNQLWFSVASTHRVARPWRPANVYNDESYRCRAQAAHTHIQVGSIQSGPNSAPCVSSCDYDDDVSLMPRTTSHYFLFSNLDITHSLFDFASNFWIQFKTLQKRIYRPILECNNGNANQKFFFSFLLSKRRHYYVSICM